MTADVSAAVYIASAWLSRLLSRLRLPACLLLVDTPALTTSTLANRSNTYKQLLNFLLITDAMDFAFDSAQLYTYDLIMPINVRTSIPIFFQIVIIHDKKNIFFYSVAFNIPEYLSIFFMSRWRQCSGLTQAMFPGAASHLFINSFTEYDRTRMVQKVKSTSRQSHFEMDDRIEIVFFFTIFFQSGRKKLFI